MTTDIITTQQGKDRLAELESVASENLHTSRQAFDRAILALTEIRDDGLWMYAIDEDGVMLQDYERPRFKEDYMYLFCRRNNISMSSTYDHLGTIAIMRHLGWTNEKISDVGVRRLKHVRKLIDIDGRSGEVKLPPPEVIEKLPPGDTIEERVNAKIEEVFIDPPEQLSPADALRSIVVDTGIAPDVNVFEAGNGDIWLTFDHCDEMWDGILIPAANYRELSDGARGWLDKKLKVTEYERRDSGID